MALQGLPQTNLHQFILSKVAPSRMLILQDQEWLQIWGKVLRSKKNDDKSAVAIMKKNDLHESVRQPVVNRDKSHDRPGRPDASVIPVMS